MKKLYIRPVKATHEGKTDEWWAIQEKDKNGKFHTLSNGIFSHAYPRRHTAEEVKERLEQAFSDLPERVKHHRGFALKDYQRLREKGYSDDEIIVLWNKDIRQRTTMDLLWLEKFDPQAVKEIFANLKRLRDNNIFESSNPNNHE